MTVTCPGPLGPVCGAAGAVGSAVLGSGIDLVLTAVTGWFVSGAGWLLSQLGDVMTQTSTPNLNASWFAAHYDAMAAIAAVVAVPMLLLAAVQSIVRQDAGMLARATFVQLPLAALLSAVALWIVQLSLSLTDQLSSLVSSGSGDQVQSALTAVAAALVSQAGLGTPGLVVALVAALVVAGSLVLWLELLVRSAAVYVAALFLPLALVGMVWPAVSHWGRRLVETLAAIVLSKFVIAAILSLGVGAVAAAGRGTGGLATVLAGAAMLVLASCSPFTLLRLVPLFEASAALHLDGARQRVAASLGSLPRTAASYALGNVVDAHAMGAAAGVASPGPVDEPTEPVGARSVGSPIGWPADNDFGKDYCTDPEANADDDGEPRYFWSEGTDGGPRGPRLAPHRGFEKAWREVLEDPPGPSREAKGGWGTGWILPYWGWEFGEPDDGSDGDEDPSGPTAQFGSPPGPGVG